MHGEARNSIVRSYTGWDLGRVTMVESVEGAITLRSVFEI